MFTKISLIILAIAFIGCSSKVPEPEFKDEFNAVPSAKSTSDIVDAGPEPQPSAKVLKKYFPKKKVVKKPKAKKKKKTIADESK